MATSAKVTTGSEKSDRGGRLHQSRDAKGVGVHTTPVVNDSPVGASAFALGSNPKPSTSTELTREIPLTRGQVVIVDAADYEWLSQWKWCAHRDRRGNYYAVRAAPRDSNGKRRVIQMHRALLDAPAGTLVDHENRNSLDNRRGNLRLCTNAENQRNCRSRIGSSSKYLGVTWREDAGKWQAKIRHAGRRHNLGSYHSEVEAALAYDAAALIHHGKFANPNFPAGDAR